MILLLLLGIVLCGIAVGARRSRARLGGLRRRRDARADRGLRLRRGAEPTLAPSVGA